jgi:uncharacterized membrane protein/glutaredoxin
MSHRLTRSLMLPISLLIALLLSLLSTGITRASDPVAHAILFYSPTCPHCHTVMNDVFPPLQKNYGSQLQILEIDVTQDEGQALYQTAISTFAITDERIGVPTLIFGQEVLVGSEEIPTRLPVLIVEALAAGGNDWPAIPGIEAWTSTEAILASTESSATSELSPFQRDPLANSLAVTLLLVMIGSALVILFTFRPPLGRQLTPWRERSIPILAIAGTGVALYLAFIELSGNQAVCGPVGDCNTVQQSPYARLFGVLPIGVLGVIGYLAILVAWALRHTKGPQANLAAQALPTMAFLGTLFSIYLTFLEPFVIGATCMWCLTSSAIMLALLWITVPRQAPEVRRGKGRRRVSAH